MGPALKIPAVMTVAEFLAWDAPEGRLWQLVDGEPQAMAPASRTHGTIQGELGRLIGNHLSERGGPCSLVVTPGVVPRVRADSNYRIPDLAHLIHCIPGIRWRACNRGKTPGTRRFQAGCPRQRTRPGNGGMRRGPGMLSRLPR